MSSAMNATMGMEAGDYLAGYDIAAHNTEAREMWAAYWAGRPARVPVVLGVNARVILLNPSLSGGVGFRRYSEDPDVMFDTQLRFQRWLRFNLLQDAELGLPERWSIGIDFQNYYEAGWFGCPVEYFDGQVPDTRPAFADCPERLLERGIPDPFANLMARGLEYYRHFQARASRETFLDRPIVANTPWCGTDGVMTAACNLFGPDFVCMAMVEEPERLHRLLDFITEAILVRVKAWRKLGNVPIPQKGFGFADDSIALISREMYREHILPYHRRICDALATAGDPRSIHLCGNATHHFRTLRDELNVQSFDTGFPVNFGRLRQELGPQVHIQGGPHIELLRTGSPQAIRAEVQRILQSGIMDGGRFILREGNNLAPCTPPQSVAAMYQACRELGRYEHAAAGM